VSFAAITFCVNVYCCKLVFRYDPVRKLLDIPSFVESVTESVNISCRNLLWGGVHEFQTLTLVINMSREEVKLFLLIKCS
jgi:hypothetical protein